MTDIKTPSIKSVYYNDINRVVSDVNLLVDAVTYRKHEQMDTYVNYIVNEVKMLVAELKTRDI